MCTFMSRRKHIRYRLTYICSKYGLTKNMHMGYVQEHFFIKNVALAGIHTLPQEAVCAGVAIRELLT